MARHVEGETVLLIGPAEAARFLLLLDHPIGPVPQVIRGAEPGQTGADDQDHGALRTDSGAGGSTAPFAGLDISMRLSQTAATTARSIATPAMTSAVAVATNIIARAAPPRAPGGGGAPAPFAGWEFQMRWTQPPATPARSIATPAMTSAVAVATNIIARAAPPSTTDAT